MDDRDELIERLHHKTRRSRAIILDILDAIPAAHHRTLAINREFLACVRVMLAAADREVNVLREAILAADSLDELRDIARVIPRPITERDMRWAEGAVNGMDVTASQTVEALLCAVDAPKQTPGG